MKRFLALFLALCLLCGCGAQAVKNSPQRVSVKNDTGTRIAERTPLPSLMDNRTLVEDNTNLWEISNEIVTSGRYQTLRIFENNLLLGWVGADTLHLQLVDIETGLLLFEAVQTGVSVPSMFLGDGKIGVCDPGKGNVTIYNHRLERLNSYQVGATPDSMYLSTDLSTLYMLSWSSGLRVRNLETGEERDELTNATDVYVYGNNGRYQNSTLVIHYLDNDTMLYECVVLNLDTGEFSYCPFDLNYVELYEAKGLWLAQLNSSGFVFLLGTDTETASVIKWSHSDLSLDETSGSIISLAQLFDDPVSANYSLYSAYTTDGRFLSSCRKSTNDCYIFGDPMWSEVWNGWFLIQIDYDTSDTHLLFWEAEGGDNPEDITMTPYSDLLPDPNSDRAVADVLYERAEELSRRSGLDIRIADQCETVYDEYATVQVYDYWQIDAALDELESVINAFPEGIFYQLTYGDIRTLEVNLTGALEPLCLPDDNMGYSSFAAFVQTGYGKNVLVYDITLTGLYANLCHEFGHMIDRKVEWDSWHREGAMFSYDMWDSLNPSDFSYAYSYYYIGDSICSGRYYDYFVDEYSRTYPTEDRARMIEYAMGEWTHLFYEDADGLLAKLDYYSLCIRDTLDTTGWPEITSWEQPLYTYGWRGGPEVG